MDLIFLIVLGIVVAYVFMLYRVEKMTDTPNVSDQIKQAVKDIYLADVEAIRNLSEVATKLQAAGLTIPGHTNVKGKMVVGTTSNAAELPAWLALSVDDTGDSHIRLKTKNDDGKNTYIINRDGRLVISAGGDFFSVDKDTTFVGNKLLVNGEINTPNGHTFKCAGRQHMVGEELLYILHKNGVMIGKEWGGNGNLSVQGDLSVQGHNITSFIPIIIDICGTDESFFNRTFTIPNKSFITTLFVDNSNSGPRIQWFKDRLIKLGRKVKGNVRQLNDFREYKDITLSIPPGKQVKFFGWDGEFQKFGSGYHEITLAFRPHAFWAGWNEFEGDFPDNIKIGLKQNLQT